MRKLKKYVLITLILSVFTLTACGEEKSEYDTFKDDADGVGESIFNFFNE
ncbi:hypothetical protein [Sporosarcina sp. FSL K6-5500]